MDNCRSDLCGVGLYEDHIPIEKLYQYVFTAGLNQTQFGIKLGTFYSQNPTGTLNISLLEHMNDYITYAAQQSIEINMSDEASSSLFTGKESTKSPTPGKQSNGTFLDENGTQTKCANPSCSKWFPSKLTSKGQYFKFCKSCNDEHYAYNKLHTETPETKTPINSLDKLSVDELKSLLALAEQKESNKKQSNVSFYASLMDDDEDY